MHIRNLRVARGWSQAHLAELTGLSVRTVQRIENGANPGLESLNRLAAALGVDLAELQVDPGAGGGTIGLVEAVRSSVRRFDQFDGVTGRTEFWWFVLAVSIAISLGTAVGVWLGTAVALVALLPIIAAAARRLRDAGQSPWWLLIGLAPVAGIVVVGILCAMPSATEPDAPRAVTTEPGSS